MPSLHERGPTRRIEPSLDNGRAILVAIEHTPEPINHLDFEATTVTQGSSAGPTSFQTT